MYKLYEKIGGINMPIYMQPKCPSCGAEGEGTFQQEFVDVISANQTLKGFTLDNEPVYGNITIHSEGFSKYVTCAKCGFKGKLFQFNRKSLEK